MEGEDSTCHPPPAAASADGIPVLHHDLPRPKPSLYACAVTPYALNGKVSPEANLGGRLKVPGEVLFFVALFPFFHRGGARKSGAFWKAKKKPLKLLYYYHLSCDIIP